MFNSNGKAIAGHRVYYKDDLAGYRACGGSYITGSGANCSHRATPGACIRKRQESLKADCGCLLRRRCRNQHLDYHTPGVNLNELILSYRNCSF